MRFWILTLTPAPIFNPNSEAYLRYAVDRIARGMNPNSWNEDPDIEVVEVRPAQTPGPDQRHWHEE